MAEASNLLKSVKTENFNSYLTKLIHDFERSYLQVFDANKQDQAREILKLFLDLVTQQLNNPYPFEIFHQALRVPFDYYQFGLDFIRPLIDFQKSKLTGLDQIQTIANQIKKGENVILLANHQTEPDPQIISLLLEAVAPQLASEMIFVAGHRVISDPLAVPLSMGRHLLCIYSKKHIELDPQTKPAKVLHNMRTMKKLAELLTEGGHCIYVAPSGGRDRADIDGSFEVSPFDAQSIELFKLMAEQSAHPTHFYPLALKTYAVMPPPKRVEKELGEKREVHFSPVYLNFCPEVDMNHFPGISLLKDKRTRRKSRADYIYSKVKEAYQSFS